MFLDLLNFHGGYRRKVAFPSGKLVRLKDAVFPLWKRREKIKDGEEL